MPGSAYIFRRQGGTPENPDFRLDATERESGSLKVQWTKYAIEANATVSDFGWVEPQTRSIEGIVTPLQVVAGAREDFDKVRATMSRLYALADGRTQVTLVTTFRSQDVVITGVLETTTAAQGRALRVKVDFQTIQRARRETIQVPPSRLRRPRRGSGSKTAAAIEKNERERGKERWQRWNDWQRGIKRRTDKARTDLPRYNEGFRQAPTGVAL